MMRNGLCYIISKFEQSIIETMDESIRVFKQTFYLIHYWISTSEAEQLILLLIRSGCIRGHYQPEFCASLI